MGKAAAKTKSSVESRHVTEAVKVILAARTAGRCEFQGCNKLLYEHHLTMEEGNYAERAHIVGFSEDGPRGRERDRVELNGLDNLMLLCPEDHKAIDDNPGAYPVALLNKWKRDHEDRVRELTSMTADAQSHVITLRARVGGQHVDSLNNASALEALRPLGLYPARHRPHDIDITGMDDGLASFYEAAAEQISKQVADLAAMKPPIVSVFALAPIPLLVHLGSRVSNKITVEFFNRHRTDNTWRWSDDGEPVTFDVKCMRKGANPKAVALFVSVSGSVQLDTLPPEIDESFTVYELTTNATPGRDVVRTRADLLRFRSKYREALEHILEQHGTLLQLHLFPAVPVSVGVVLGHDILPKAYPSLWVYDNRQPKGFALALKVHYDV